MFGDLFKLLTAGLTLWGDKEKHKYLDRAMSLEKDYYDEYNKPLDQRSDARLDNLEFQLRILSRAFVAGVGAANAPASAGGSGS